MNKSAFLFFVFTALTAVLLLSFTSSHNGVFKYYSSTDTNTPYLRAKDHLGQSVTNSNSLVTLTSGFDNDFYQLDSINRSGFMYVEAKLANYVNENARRTPLNISIVIDRSGSMKGAKLGYAKKAAKEIIRQLTAEDYVSIVMYDQAVDSVQSPTHPLNKDLINARIDGISARGTTNLWGGTENGYEYVLRNYRSEFVNRVLLISDGLANTGLTDSLMIRYKVQRYKDDNGITISTFGVGLDYNERLMTDMAETGSGNYYFIDAPEKLTGIFKKELNGLLNVAARDAELHIKIPKGVTVEKISPFKFDQSGDEIIVRFRDLFSEEIKGMLIKFKIDNSTKMALKWTTSLNYTDLTSGQKTSITNENVLSPVKELNRYLTYFNKDVVKQTILFTANENLEKAMLEVDKGNLNQAKVYIDMNSGYLKTNYRYVGESSELKNMDSVNRVYTANLKKTGTMAADSIKLMQKSGRAANYRARNKKQ